MFRPSPLWYLAVSFSLSIRAQTMLPDLQPSPSSRIGLSLFRGSDHPAFKGIFGDQPDSVSSSFVVLANQSEQNIIAVTVVWSAVDPSGKSRKFVTSCDSSQRLGSPPVAASGERMLIGPHTCMTEAVASRLGRSNLHASGGNDPLIALAQAVKVDIAVDSIVLANGELIGADQRHMGTDVAARSAAARTVASQVRDALNAKLDPAPVLSGVITAGEADLATFERSIVSQGGISSYQHHQELQWTLTFAKRLQTSVRFDLDLAFLERYPIVPALFRNANP